MTTIGPFFERQAAKFAENPLICVPADAARAYHPAGYEISYGAAAAQIAGLRDVLASAGYGHGHRIAILMENRPEMLLLKLAANALGISSVPVNPDYRPNETAYLLRDSGAQLCVAAPALEAQMRAGIDEAGLDLPLALYDETVALRLSDATSPPPIDGPPTPETEASLVYTSGTTGRPKGCVLSHDYELRLGDWYVNLGGLIDVREGRERIYCPLPLFHVNAGILLIFGMIASGGCQIVPERFRASRWWAEIVETRATGCHYLGIIIPALMNRPESPEEKAHGLRWAAGAGVEPTLHAPAERRFGFPLVEVWGMTEMCRILTDNHEPRLIHTRAMGRPKPGLDVRVVDEEDREVPRGVSGEMVLRHSKETPRKGFFSGYLNLPEATEEAWRTGWFHTGDTVKMDESGMVFFVDRKKNIIRRSGENIAAAEIEACLQDHPQVASVAVIAVADAMRDEEVMACVVANGAPSAALAQELFDYTFERLAYFKAPGWLQFRESLPVTSTQKIQKHAIYGPDEDPLKQPDTHDFRKLKKRQ